MSYWAAITRQPGLAKAVLLISPWPMRVLGTVPARVPFEPQWVILEWHTQPAVRYLRRLEGAEPCSFRTLYELQQAVQEALNCDETHSSGSD